MLFQSGFDRRHRPGRRLMNLVTGSSDREPAGKTGRPAGTARLTQMCLLLRRDFFLGRRWRLGRS